MIESFLQDLFGQGKVRVELPDARARDNLAEHFASLRDPDIDARLWEQWLDYERVRRNDFPGEAPPPARQAALWSVDQLYRACVATVVRELSADQLRTFLSVPCPPGDPVATHYSVDLVFQFLPDLWRLARQISPRDPLVGIVRDWGSRWPLSSLGIRDEPLVSDEGIETPRCLPLDDDALRVVREHSGLLCCYVDRVIARGASDRLSDARVADAVRCAIGGQRSRFPEFASLFSPRIDG